MVERDIVSTENETFKALKLHCAAFGFFLPSGFAETPASQKVKSSQILRRVKLNSIATPSDQSDALSD